MSSHKGMVIINDGLKVIAFLECKLTGKWKQLMPHPGTEMLVNQAQDDLCLIDVLRTDNELFTITFKRDAKISIIGNAVILNEKSIVSDGTDKL